MKRMFGMLMLFFAQLSNPMVSSPIIKMHAASADHIDRPNWAFTLDADCSDWQECFKYTKTTQVKTNAPLKQDDDQAQINREFEEIMNTLIPAQFCESDDVDNGHECQHKAAHKALLEVASRLNLK